MRNRINGLKFIIRGRESRGEDTTKYVRERDRLVAAMKDLYPPYEAGMPRHPITRVKQ
jgi:hypothetical protein